MGSNFDNLGIRKRFAILRGIFVLGFAFFGLWSFKTLNGLQVNGRLFQRIVKNKDLVADTLPPPAYIIKSYLTALQISTASDSNRRHALIQALQHLRKDYNDAHEKWKASGIGPNLQDMLLKQADAAVAKMDHTTQQNAALVEVMASVAMSLKRQANDLVASVAVFTLPESKNLSANRLGFSPGLAPVGY